MTITDMFKQLIENLRIDNRGEISSRYCNITKILNRKYYSSESEINNSLQVGSYGRKTAIKGISDLDMIYVLPQNMWDRFKDRQSALLQEIKTTLLLTYPRTEIKGDGQVVVINFTNGQVVEILPCFEQDDGSFKYADTNNGGSWKITKPRLEIQEIQALDDTKNKNLKRLCKMVRAWKNKHGVAMGGLLIDALAYDFLNTTTKYDDKSFLYYDCMVRDFFKYLKELPEAAYILAPGSNQRVYIKKSFQKKAKKAYDLVIDAISTGAGTSAHKAWKKVFGRPFPNRENINKSMLTDSHTPYTDTEEFIENKFNIDIRYALKIDCEVSQNGYRERNLRDMIINKLTLKANKTLRFLITENELSESGDCNFEIYWKVLNRGEEAKKRNQIRGQIRKNGKSIQEHTNFIGDHIVECYIVKNNCVVAKDRIHVPIQ